MRAKAWRLVFEENLTPAAKDLANSLLKINSLGKEVAAWSQISNNAKRCPVKTLVYEEDSPHRFCTKVIFVSCQRVVLGGEKGRMWHPTTGRKGYLEGCLF